MAQDLARATLVSARTSAASGTTTTLATVTNLGTGSPLYIFDDLFVYLVTSTSIAGTVPTLDVWLQMAVVPNPVSATDAHWDDIARFTQVTGAALEILVLGAAKPIGAANAGSTVDVSHNRGIDQTGFTQGAAFNHHWGEVLRIREVTGGTITTNAVYSIHALGVRR